MLSFYDKPSIIENKILLNTNNLLLTSVVEHFDYEVVSAPVWKHLTSWYQYDY
jgi:hypothetical protein